MEDVLIVVGGSSSHFKKQRNWSRFNLYLHNQGCYGKTDDSAGFSASNRSIHVLRRRSNCSWGALHRWIFKNSEIGANFAYISTTKGAKIGDVIEDSSITSDRTGKRIAEFDPSRKISLNAPWSDVYNCC